MLILCILRHDQTLDPDVPFGKRPCKKSQSNGARWSNFRLWMAVTNLTKISDNKQPVKRISAVVARSAAIKRNSLASRSPFAPPSFPPDKIKQINDILDNLGVHKAFQKVTESDGFFGRGHLYLDNGVTNDDDELGMDLGDGRNLLSKQKVGSDKSGKSQRLIRILPVEATWCYPTRYDSVDPLSPDWYRPITWFVPFPLASPDRFSGSVREPERESCLLYTGHRVASR